MIDPTPSHLPEATLQEYADGALDGAARGAAAAHLAGCAVCAARLDRLQALFRSLDDLPDAPLAHDLRAGVMVAVRARSRTRLRPIADPRQPAFRVVFIAQLALALVLLAFGLPAIGSSAAALAPLTGQALSTIGLDAASAWSAVQLPALAIPPVLPASELPQPIVAGLGLVAAAIFWLASNALLLRPEHGPRRRL